MMTRWFNSLPYVKPFIDDFIFTVKTDNAGTSGTNQFTLPTTGSDFDCIVNWGDGTSDAYVGTMGSPTHTYPSVGTYEIKISGVFPRILFNNAGDRLKIREIKNLGIYGLGSTNQQGAFWGCSNMIITAKDIGNFGLINFLANFLAYCIYQQGYNG
jgi:trimeric autotransporter adhesin